MKLPACVLPRVVLVGWVLAGAAGLAQEPPADPFPLPPERARLVPDPLRPWVGWAAWDEKDIACPTQYDDGKARVAFWPSRLALEVDEASGRFALGVEAFRETWVPLPGGGDVWPVEVVAGGGAVPVVEHQGRPAVRLPAGRHELRGAYRWHAVPQRIPMPGEIGILSLALNGRPVEAPVWDAQGFLWLKRDAATEETDKDFLAVKLHSCIADGIPMWLRNELELIVAGKSREETIGVVLPAGWKLSVLESPIPVAVDGSGSLKAQVRAGKWVVKLDAFRLDHPAEVAYAAGGKPAVGDQLVAFQARPDFRLVEVSGIPSIDVSQTPFPDKWRNLPVYRWETGVPFRLEERMRGMGLQKPEGLAIARELWLDEDGRGLTFQDRITGKMQQVWRLDAAEGQELGSVRAAGEGQLITRNPGNGALGVEIRGRNLALEATGRMPRDGALSATGWRSDADGLQVELNLPPGWRLLALFGADWVAGDWLTAWTLLDLFLLLIFTLAIFRLWGFPAAVLAFVAFGLAYHEPGAPRYTLLVLLVPLALLRVVPAGWGRRLLVAFKWLNVLALVLVLAPFLGRQIQQALYPQLERVGHGRWAGMAVGKMAAEADAWSRSSYALPSSAPRQEQAAKIVIKENLAYDTKARIQTGPGVPAWSWRKVSFGWNGPVQASQSVRPILIPQGVERGLTVLRVLLLVALVAVLLNRKRMGAAVFQRAGKAAALVVAAICYFGGPDVSAQVPDKELLETLRARLTEPSDAYPTAADIPSVSLTLRDRKLAIEAEIHAAIRTAVPLPGRLPAWSPVAVLVDGQPEAALRRDDGYLWVVLPPGVHRVRVEGMLINLTEWEWTFRLKPRRVAIDAPGWTISGVRPDGTPEGQVFFALKQKSAEAEASYDRPDLQTALQVERRLEVGLVWQVSTTVRRLSPGGKAVSLRVPLLPGENVVTSNMVVREGMIEVRLGANAQSFAWQSELTQSPRVQLATKPGDGWVERWQLVASPVWNVGISGLAPVFEAGSEELTPVWQPWPGESVALEVSRPEAVAGATVTVGKVTHEITLGKRQRASTLGLALRCSLGEDFLVELPADAETASLTSNGKAIPVRKDGHKVIVPLAPGEQQVELAWKSNTPLGFAARAEAVRLPVESANIETEVGVPDNRWVLWAGGPLRGPAVRFWGILVCSLLAAWVLGRASHSPLRTLEWMLLAIGLTQIPLRMALVVVAWFFFLAWRGRDSFLGLRGWLHNLLQVVLIVLTAVVVGTFIAIVAEGLLGSPEMFIIGNGSTRTALRWFEARSDGTLPQPFFLSVSIWWYRLLMLVWALWLAASLIRWLRWAWQQFSAGSCFRAMWKPKAAPPPLPAGDKA